MVLQSTTRRATWFWSSANGLGVADGHNTKGSSNGNKMELDVLQHHERARAAAWTVKAPDDNTPADYQSDT
jgi:hypothetical protein